jgi:hypothetical protein
LGEAIAKPNERCFCPEEMLGFAIAAPNLLFNLILLDCLQVAQALLPGQSQDASSYMQAEKRAARVITIRYDHAWDLFQ